MDRIVHEQREGAREREIKHAFLWYPYPPKIDHLTAKQSISMIISYPRISGEILYRFQYEQIWCVETINTIWFYLCLIVTFAVQFAAFSKPNRTSSISMENSLGQSIAHYESLPLIGLHHGSVTSSYLCISVRFSENFREKIMPELSPGWWESN